MTRKLTIVRQFVTARWLRNLKTVERVRRYQEKGIARHGEFLHQNSPFYARLPLIRTIEDVQQLPIMDKQTMMANFNETNTLGLDRDTALEIAIESERNRDFQPTYQGVSVGLSSGTSGHRGLFVVSEQEQSTWAGVVLAKFLPRGEILDRHRIAFFLRANNNLYESVGSSRIQFRYFDVYQGMADHIAKLQTYQPTVLIAPPSVLGVIADAIESGELQLRPKKIISVAEVLTDFDAARFRQVFQHEIIFQAYQCTEGFLAFTCEEGSIHLNEEFVYFEKEFLDEKRFVPILTDFTRKTQPIIRYRLNDVLVLGEQNCRCGAATTIIERIEGREDDVFQFATESGEKVTVFPDVIGRCVVLSEGIKQYRVIQTAHNRVEIQVEPRSPEIVEAIEQEFARLAAQLGFVMPELSFTDFQPDLSRKLKRIENKVS